MLDVVIIGAGPIGLACGIEAEKNKLSYCILEKGCTVNSIYRFPVNMTFFSTSERLEIGEVPFISHGDKPTRSEALEYFRRVRHAWNLKVNTYETVTSVIKESGWYRVGSDKAVYETRCVVIATGYFDNPNLLNIPGENLDKVFHYFREAHPYSDRRVLVVGGGNSAVDVALECFRRGSEVTMILREAELQKSVKYWVKPDIENRIKEGAVTAYFNSTVTEIREYEVDIQTLDGRRTLANDFVFAMTGYHPDYTFLKGVGIRFTQTGELIPYHDEETFETNLGGVYLAGVVCGGMNTSKWFIENAREHPRKIFQHIVN